MSFACTNCGAPYRQGANYCNGCSQRLSVNLPVRIAPLPSNFTAPALIGDSSSSAAYIELPDGRQVSLHGIAIAGREANANISLVNDNEVSRSHFSVQQSGTQWTLIDQASSNGTWVNGIQAQPYKQTVLVNGDQIQVGQTLLIFRQPNAVVPQVVQPINPLGANAQNLAVIPPQQQLVNWKAWTKKKAPFIEGVVRDITQPRPVEKGFGDQVRRGLLIGGLAAMSPFLGYAGAAMMGKGEITERDVRIEDRHSAKLKDIKIVGELTANVQLGDHIAVWVKQHKHMLLLTKAYNYETDTEIQLKK